MKDKEKGEATEQNSAKEGSFIHGSLSYTYLSSLIHGLDLDREYRVKLPWFRGAKHGDRFTTKSPAVAAAIAGALAIDPSHNEVLHNLVHELPIAEARVKKLARSHLVTLRDKLLSETQIQELDLGVADPDMLAPIAGDELNRRDPWRNLPSGIALAAGGAIAVLIFQAVFL